MGFNKLKGAYYILVAPLCYILLGQVKAPSGGNEAADWRMG